MEGFTRLVLRHRYAVLVAWLVVFIVAGWASSQLSGLLTNRFTLPGTDTRRAEVILKDHFGQRSTGSFTVVARSDGRARALVPEVGAAAERAVAELPTSRLVSVTPVTPDVTVAQIVSDLEPADSKSHTDDMRAAIGAIPGATVFLTGQAAIEHDLDPVFGQDLVRGELIALPIALAILIVTFGTLSFLIPFAFALVTIPTTLAIVWVFANFMELSTYLQNLVSLIGLGIAIDYSLLVVYRFREELRAGLPRDEAIVKTMATAGRAVVFSGTAVAIGLAMLVFMPLPFLRGFGIGGLFIPAVSVLAAVTFLPVVLSVAGERLDRVRVLPRGWLDHRDDTEHGFWAVLARFIMRYPKLVASATAGFLILLTLPLLSLQLGPGSNEGIPRDLPAVRGYDVLTAAVGAGAVSPTNIVIDTGRAGGAAEPAVTAAVGRLERRLETDPEVALVQFEDTPQHVDPTQRYLNVEVTGKRDYGKPESLAFVSRLRDVIVPGAGFPGGVSVYAGGGPPGRQGLPPPHLQLVPMAARRRPPRDIRPAHAGVPLDRAPAEGDRPQPALDRRRIRAPRRRLQVGRRRVGGLIPYDQIEGWIPVFLFAMLFGLSMDYEVFLVSRMREEWDSGATNEEAVVLGLTKTGRLVTAAGFIMFAAFRGSSRDRSSACSSSGSGSLPRSSST